MANNTKEDLKFWAKIRGLAWRVRNAKVDNADIAVDNLVEHINSVMTRNSLIDQQKQTINNTSDDELLQHKVMATIAFALAPYIFDFKQEKRDKFLDEVTPQVVQLIRQREEQVAREIKTLNTHLSFMAGQYEGITGEKSAYLLKNWPEHKHLTTTHKGDQ